MEKAVRLRKPQTLSLENGASGNRVLFCCNQHYIVKSGKLGHFSSHFNGKKCPNVPEFTMIKKIKLGLMLTCHLVLFQQSGNNVQYLQKDVQLTREGRQVDMRK